MTQRRFFISQDAIEGNMAKISGPDVHHLRRVLRLEPGDEITIVAKDRQYRSKILQFHDQHVLCALGEATVGVGEPPVEVILLQGLPKGEKVELIIQKAVEIGVGKIILIDTERSVVKLDSAKAQKRLSRWRRIALEAAKQCQRSHVPSVEGIYKLSQWLKMQETDEETLFLVPWEGEAQLGMGQVLQDFPGIKRVIILIGPEGGLEEAEVELARSYGAIPVTLGPRILRTETAAIVAVALVLYAVGDLN